MGKFSWEWFLPIKPTEGRSDGFNFPIVAENIELVNII
jgi:hypothetical protein